MTVLESFTITLLINTCTQTTLAVEFKSDCPNSSNGNIFIIKALFFPNLFIHPCSLNELQLGMLRISQSFIDSLIW